MGSHNVHTYKMHHVHVLRMVLSYPYDGFTSIKFSRETDTKACGSN